MRPFDGRSVLLIVGGGIAAYKSASLVRRLRGAGAAVDVVLTSGGERFIGATTFEGLTGRPVGRDLWERSMAHLELGREADVAVVAPATADLLARLAAGTADDLATTTLLAAACPVIVCPAMNVRMWEHPATRENLDRLRGWGVRVVGPGHGELAEGEVGWGRMAEPGEIVAEAGRVMEEDSPLAGRGVVVTAGPTRAPLDPVRYLGNRSSGRMGYALAASAWRRGADVALVTGPGTAPRPHGPRQTQVETSAEMLEALRAELEGASVLLMAAAVGDYEFARPSRRKLKREGEPERRVTLRRGPDLLEETRTERAERGILSLGFALETDDAVENGRRKLDAKGLDFIAVNEVGEDSGFEVTTNRITLLDREGNVEQLPLLTKEEAADRILDRVEERFAG